MGEGIGVSFQQDFNWQANYYPSIKRILARNAMKIITIDIADAYEDMKHATDFTVTVKGGMVAARVRKPTPFRDLTIRSKRPSGHETELQKIKNGFADFYVYAWTNYDGRIIEWWLVDIGKMRTAGLFEKPRQETRNKDNSSDFVAFQKSELLEIGALIDEWVHVPALKMNMVAA